MKNLKVRLVLALLAIGLVGSMTVPERAEAVTQQATLAQLEAKFQQQYAAIQSVFFYGPAKKVFPPDPRQRVRLWQDELARSFAEAAATVEEILKLHPANEASWREQLETMQLYSQPISPPQTRSVFGSTEVKKTARLLDAPAAVYTDPALQAKAKGEVRLRLVLAADGAVKNIFPMKPLKYGLTEAAIEAARRIKFEPAIRDGQRVSQFATLSYEFKNGKGQPPYKPKPEFYF